MLRIAPIKLGLLHVSPGVSVAASFVYKFARAGDILENNIDSMAQALKLRSQYR